MKEFFKSIKPIEWIIWSVGIATVTVCFFVFRNTQYHYLIGTLIGVTALLFVSKGNPIGQVLTIVFSVFYGVIAYPYRYYGEMITYLGMTLPIAVVALVTWIKNPYKKNEVRVNRISAKEWAVFAALSAGVTAAFYFILRALGTANLIISTLSVFTSFFADYMAARRSRFYALGYGLNDIVLIIMWSLALAESMTYLPIVLCFVFFFIFDLYGFINWTIMGKRQKREERPEKEGAE